MASKGKRFNGVVAKVDRDSFYELDAALTLVKETASAKFDESVDVAINLGVNAKKSDQNVRGATVLPRGTGKTVRVAVFADGDDAALDNYSVRALDRVWKTERFSWWLTQLTHRFTDDPFEQRMKEAELAYITTSDAGRQMVAENYVGLPL